MLAAAMRVPGLIRVTGAGSDSVGFGRRLTRRWGFGDGKSGVERPDDPLSVGKMHVRRILEYSGRR